VQSKCEWTIKRHLLGTGHRVRKSAKLMSSLIFEKFFAISMS
jgi:hypothetical protein